MRGYNKFIYLSNVKIILVLLVMTIVGIFSVGCSKVNDLEQSSINAVGDDVNVQENVENHTNKLKVVTTLFPQYDFAKQIGGNAVEVTLLLPPGVEAHSYEPTPQDIVTIQNADLFLYTGEQMEPWAHHIIEGLSDKKVKVVDLSEGIGLLEFSEEHGHNHDKDGHEEDENHNHDKDGHEEDENHNHDKDAHDHDGHHHDGVDPHIWLSPENAMIMLDHTTSSMCEVSKDNAKYFTDNAKAYGEQLKLLDRDFADVFNHTDTHTIVSGGHFAFGYFVDYYGLDFISPYKGFAPDAEPTPKEVAKLIEFIKNNNVHAIYYEELVNPRVAQTVANETNVQMYKLHAAHNISKEEREQGVTYISLMRDNMENLKKGMGYR